jgi:hypothetical protein
MTEHDPEFEDFLKRRKPLFRRDVDDGLEPPPELDRLVLRQAREAIRAEDPLPLYRGPRWAAPLAIAATLMLGLAVVFHVADQQSPAPDVTVENVAQRSGDSAELGPPEAAPAATATATAATRRADTSTADSATWRRSPEAWLAEIERLRAAGDTARAEAEMAEYNRQQRAFAASPDR